MTIFNYELEKAFSERRQHETYAALRSTYEESLTRKLDYLALPKEGISPVNHAKWCCATCQQSLLHRTIYLFEASIEALRVNNIYAMTLCIRGHYEATASMGHTYRRIISLLEGNVGLYEFHESLHRQLMGSKEVKRAPPPLNIMSMLKSADKILNKHLFAGGKQNMLTDGYEFLCEFAHPNFHSYNLAMRVDHESRAMIFRHGEAPRDEEFGLIGYIVISNGLFLELFDRFGESLRRIEVSKGC